MQDLGNIIITEEEQNKDVFVSRVEIRTHFKDLIRKKRHKFPNISEEDKIFQILSNEANGNPLGLTLLGKLFVQCSKIKTDNASLWKKDVDSLENYKDIFNSERKNLALSILEKHYANWKASSDDRIIARIIFLQILSLLSRPMQEEEFNFLFEIIKGNSNKIKENREQIEGTFKISYNDNKLIEFINPITTFQQKDKEITESQGFLDMEDDLQNLGLIVKRNAFKWDTHSLVRSFFTDKFSNENAEGWRSAHAILLIYFAPKKTDRRPETQVQLLPVSRAIHHGCLSQNYQAAYQFYENFVIRRYDGFITENLGLVAWDLSILSRFSFLNDLSDEKLKGLTITQEQLCDLLSRKAYCIELQGEFEKAIDLRQTTINRYDTIINELKSDTKPSCEFKVRYVKALKDQAHAYEKLTWLLARTDSLDKAETEAKKGVARALNAVTEAKDEIKEDCHFTKEEINKEYEKVGLTIKEVEEQTYQSYATLGAIYHRLGQLGNAKINFEKAEKLYQNAEIGDNDKDSEQAPKSRYLHSEPGCRYCFFLIDSLHDKTMAIAERPSLHDIKVRINYMRAWNRAEEKKHKYKRNYKEGEQIGFHQRPPTLLIQAAHQLAIGGFYLAKNQSEDNEIGESDNVEMAEKAFNEAIQLTQKAHNKSFQCQPLLARAMLRRYSKRYSLALRDLEKVIELAGKMKLYQVDAELLKGNVLLDQALSLFKNKSEEKPFYRDYHELSTCYYLIEKAECCLENVKKNIKDLTYTLRYTNQELLKLRIDIAKLEIKCIEGIDNETIEKEIQLLEDKLEHIGNQKNNKPIPEHDYKSVEIEIEKFRT